MTDAIRTYEVKQVSGKPFPDPHYVVLEIAHDYCGRVAARSYQRMLVSQKRMSEAALVDELLRETETIMAAYTLSQNPQLTRKKKRKK